jgi:hypothetical protein
MPKYRVVVFSQSYGDEREPYYHPTLQLLTTDWYQVQLFLHAVVPNLIPGDGTETTPRVEITRVNPVE